MQNKILLAGGTGLIGSRLIEILRHRFEIHILTRGESRVENQIHYHQWNLAEGSYDISDNNFDVIINLTGAGIADKRWSENRKKLLLSSRIESTRLIKKIIQGMSKKPDLYLGASAIGYYGDRGEDILTESDQPSDGFLSECCVVWEEEHLKLQEHADRFAILRIGIVLSRNGGALPKLITPAKLGGSGYFGNGSSYYAWIHIDDLCGMILQLIEDKNLSGIFNGTSQKPAKLKDLATAVRNVFAPYAFVLPIPAIGLKLALGQMSSMLLNSTRVISKEWEKVDFPYKYPELELALDDLKKRRV